MSAAERRRIAMRAKRVSDARIPPLAGSVVRKGRAPQKVGIYGRTSMYYKTSATIDQRWDFTAHTNRADLW